MLRHGVAMICCQFWTVGRIARQIVNIVEECCCSGPSVFIRHVPLGLFGQMRNWAYVILPQRVKMLLSLPLDQFVEYSNPCRKYLVPETLITVEEFIRRNLKLLPTECLFLHVWQCTQQTMREGYVCISCGQEDHHTRYSTESYCCPLNLSWWSICVLLDQLMNLQHTRAMVAKYSEYMWSHSGSPSNPLHDGRTCILCKDHLPVPHTYFAPKWRMKWIFGVTISSLPHCKRNPMYAVWCITLRVAWIVILGLSSICVIRLLL